MTAIASETLRHDTPAVALAEFARYFAVSALAFAIDASLYALALHARLPYEAAAAAGFVAGVTTAYGLSVRWVFRDRNVANRRAEFLAFIAIGIVGLGVTEAMLWLQIQVIGIGPVVAKLGAAAAVFLFNFGARKLLLFTRRPLGVIVSSPAA